MVPLLVLQVRRGGSKTEPELRRRIFSWSRGEFQKLFDEISDYSQSPPPHKDQTR